VTATKLLCFCDDAQFEPVFTYTEPPRGETQFRFSTGRQYRREVLRCRCCGHFVSVHVMDTADLYSDDYARSTYGPGGIQGAFERIIALDPSGSDNAGRVRRVLHFAASHLGLPAGGPSVLDVGSGLCVFLHGMKAAGWRCTALDPNDLFARHARERVGVEAVCGDFMAMTDLGRFDVVAFNKVLEHVQDPVAMLARSAGCLRDGGFVYVEVPDGESAVADGPGREEFFIEHWHVFSAASLALLAVRAGFSARVIERLREPSGKYTLWAFLTPNGHGRD